MTSTVSSLSTPSSVMIVSPLDEDGGFNENDHDEEEEDDTADIYSSPIFLLFRDYGWRIFGTSMSWLLWDISFYGNKLFQSTFLIAITGENASLLELSSAAALNAFVALLGYFAASQLLDHPLVGRFRLQQSGFLITGILFIICGAFNSQLSNSSDDGNNNDNSSSGDDDHNMNDDNGKVNNNNNTITLLILYFLSSFFGQCGPNSTTFLLPAELVPTSQRTLCHGIAAASGKVGALLAALLFPSFQNESDLFLWSGYASLTACIITAWTIPELGKLDNLEELDALWRLTLQGKKSTYHGPAKQFEFLSYQERYQRMMKRHDRQYYSQQYHFDGGD